MNGKIDAVIASVSVALLMVVKMSRNITVLSEKFMIHKTTYSFSN